MTSASDRLAALRERLGEGRGENLDAVEDECKLLREVNRAWEGQSPVVHKDDQYRPILSIQDAGGGNSRRKRLRRASAAPGELSDMGSAEEAEGEDEDDRLRSMKRRARRIIPRRNQASEECSEDRARQATVITYGSTGCGVPAEDVDRMVSEVRQLEKRRENFRRRRAFSADQSDITFINEGNRLFNRTLDSHFDKFESVQKIKDSLERGTA